ncbi:superoxide dismutase [Cu-Zn] SodC [Azospirillum sp. SYSU D00513]|uniref:superoxide dismutase [Cu-Zn] SodC n=1 Tax=Azospirillum sp. SYSU D00513 TaxID=2812561 RepID=UPI0032B3CAFD
MKTIAICGAAAFLLAAGAAQAATTVTINQISKDGVGKEIGTIAVQETDKGVTFTPNLSGLPAGEHGFHVHQNPDCGPAENNGAMAAGFAAGGHYDPSGTKKHQGPQHAGSAGHLGDLPALTVAANGEAKQAVTAPNLKLTDVQGRSLMIHEGSDNYSDEPKPLGGGGGRIACGVVK